VCASAYMTTANRTPGIMTPNAASASSSQRARGQATAPPTSATMPMTYSDSSMSTPPSNGRREARGENGKEQHEICRVPAAPAVQRGAERAGDQSDRDDADPAPDRRAGEVRGQAGVRASGRRGVHLVRD